MASVSTTGIRLRQRALSGTKPVSRLLTHPDCPNAHPASPEGREMVLIKKGQSVGMTTFIKCLDAIETMKRSD